MKPKKPNPVVLIAIIAVLVILYFVGKQINANAINSLLQKI